ncbi:hypothetical protein DSO57_1016871 [Entomophthora muscae]|uniref:Uncharacterized protein n=1 Tax=Entomophthora muscae TaxID=34485 RepID=A0ACC2TSD1_9FUNG|nr:hypothetical protein DSO57_1016871 [Entomophthora muscae]
MLRVLREMLQRVCCNPPRRDVWVGNDQLIAVLVVPGRKTKLKPKFVPRKFCDPSLNPSQQGAVSNALSAHLVSLIHGPPGTGKTQTLVELINQLIRKKQRILVCSASNAAVGKSF